MRCDEEVTDGDASQDAHCTILSVLSISWLLLRSERNAEFDDFLSHI
jgi:hypothetical protein